MSRRAPNFDRIAGLYRWLEYLALGSALEDTRLCLLDHVPQSRRAFILGDGDGRFAARLLAAQPGLHAEAIDLSGEMLRLLRGRCAAFATRLATHQADARVYPFDGSYDLVVSHFFLDCLTDEELRALLTRMQAHLAPRACWLVSEFAVPAGLLHWPARLYVRSLYFAFRMLTGLRPTRLPDYPAALARAGFRILRTERRVFGLLRAELWQTFHTEESA